MLFLVHHADAVGPEIDPQRPLSTAGRTHADRLARLLAERGVKPHVIWHSGKLRARQTAEAIWRSCNPLAELTTIRGLQPMDPPEWIRDLIAGDTRDLMLVGHMPSLPRILEFLTGVTTTERGFPQHGAVALDVEENRWVERWRIE